MEKSHHVLMLRNKIRRAMQRFVDVNLRTWEYRRSYCYIVPFKHSNKTLDLIISIIFWCFEQLAWKGLMLKWLMISCRWTKIVKIAMVVYGIQTIGDVSELAIATKKKPIIHIIVNDWKTHSANLHFQPPTENRHAQCVQTLPCDILFFIHWT